MYTILHNQKGLEIFNQILKLWSMEILKKALCYMFIISNICVGPNCDYLLIHTIHDVPDMIGSWNLLWEKSFIFKVDLWFHQLEQMAFPKSVFISANFTVRLPNLLRPNLTSLACGKIILNKRSSAWDGISKKKWYHHIYYVI